MKFQVFTILVSVAFGFVGCVTQHLAYEDDDTKIYVSSYGGFSQKDGMMSDHGFKITPIPDVGGYSKVKSAHIESVLKLFNDKWCEGKYRMAIPEISERIARVFSQATPDVPFIDTYRESIGFIFYVFRGTDSRWKMFAMSKFLQHQILISYSLTGMGQNDYAKREQVYKEGINKCIYIVDLEDGSIKEGFE